MKSAIISATIIGLFVALSQAVAIPAEVVEARQSEEALLFFVGATPDANYTLSVAVGGPSVAIGKSIYFDSLDRLPCVCPQTTAAMCRGILSGSVSDFLRITWPF